jgi:carbon storage regulator
MLVLTRRVGESIVINYRVRLTVLEANGKRVRLGIAAPSNVLVDRLEIYARRQQSEQSMETEDVSAGD